jgi:tyrosine-protein kinase Etk/Wzc
MQEKKLSNINDEIDIRLFLYLLKKNLVLFGVLFMIAISSAFLYLRYTPPIYETFAIIQLNNDNEARKILQPNVGFEENNNLEEQMELMRSSVFLQRVITKLPLDISYFVEGRILDFELYKNSPYTVNYTIKNSAIYGVPVFVNFPDEQKVKISYHIDDNASFEKTFNLKDNIVLNEMDIAIHVSNIQAVLNKSGLLNSDNFYFIITDPSTNVSSYARLINISIMNEAAKTVSITFRGNNAQKSSDIVNTIAEEFLNYDIEKKAESTNKIIEFIDKQLNRIYDTLAKSENQLENFKKTNKIDTFKLDIVPTLFSRQSELESQLSKLDLEENMLNDVEKNFTASEDVDIYKLIASVAGSEFQGTISGLLKTLQELLLKREQLLYEVTPNSSQIKSVNFQIDIQKKLLIESIKSLKSNIQSRKSELIEKIHNYEKLIVSKSGDFNAIELNRLQRIYAINEQFHNQLIEKRAEYSIMKAGYVSQNLILEKSNPPSHPVSPKKRQVYFTVIIAAFLLSLIIVLLIYLFYNEIKSVDDITKHSNASILGVLPKYRYDIPKSLMIVDKKPKSLIAESLRIVRTNLQFISNEPGPKVIAITSTVSGEGKTFIAVNLAAILAFSEKKVILLDLDMRKPKLHDEFRNENKCGISSILAGHNLANDCINQTGLQNLDYISAGPIPPNPSELIMNQRMDDLILHLKSKYDFIIIDTPPVGLVTDGIKSLTKADYPIYVFKANSSKRNFISNVDHLIDDNNINLSIILNSVIAQNLSYGKPKSYSNGYGYGYYDDEKIPTLFNKILQFFKLKKSV